jgi:UDPglucose--hexose-1-phosphate uridylyltransferase
VSRVTSGRNHPITGEPIIFAPERAARPRAFGGEDTARCPFCPGHESDTPPAIATAGDPWRLRIFPNKYPPVAGAEVIVESPAHGQTFADVEHAAEVVRAYVERYRAHAGSPYTAVFKNEGARGGASIPHVHSQVVPLPFLPPRVVREAAGFARAARCPLCPLDGHVIRETARFTWLAPSGSSMPYQQWIVPKRHVSEMTAFTASEQEELARLLRSAAAAMLRLGDSYNWVFMNFPASTAADRTAAERAGHCYIDLFPRLAAIAGLELGTGTFVEIIDPAAAARRLRA